jgi:hypothetical protein
MRTAFKYLVTVSVVLGLASLAAADEWKAYSSTAGRYSTMFPGTPKEMTQRAENGVDATVAMLQIADTFYAVAFSELPKEAQAKQTPDQILDARRKEEVDRVKGKLVSEKKVAADGYPGRELLIDAPGELQLTVHAFVVKTRLYQVLVLARKSKGTPDDTKKFLESFKLSAP